LQALLSAQNPDGGWGYRRGGSSWVEPSVYALLALRDLPEAAEAVRRGRAWLRGLQRADGGWAPHAAVRESTWVTALVLLLEGLEGAGDRALGWILRQTGREATWLYRARMKLLGVSSDYEAAPPAWPWYPGTAAWVMPTSITLLALRKVSKVRPEAEIRERIREGRRFLLVRRCADGGWNHGSSKALGFQINSYPETTGLALLALEAEKAPGLERSLEAAERHLARCRSAEGAAWLEMGLRAHGRPASAPSSLREDTLMDAALRLLARRAAQGNNPLLG